MAIRQEVKAGHVFKTMASPVGRLTLVALADALAAVLWENDDPKRVRVELAQERRDHPVLLETERQLNAYFACSLKEFSVPMNLAGTDFQRDVWAALRAIPFGETRTYAQIAVQIGKPEAVRAVGAAIGRNPISIVVPCHRVIGSNGSLTGFAGGLLAKAHLLHVERGGTRTQTAAA